MRITSKGQVTIPADIRAKAGLLPGTEVEFTFDGQVVTLRQPRGRKRNRGVRVVRQMRRRGDVKLSTEAILALTRSE